MNEAMGIDSVVASSERATQGIHEVAVGPAAMTDTALI
jgi:hypothetical protein